VDTSTDDADGQGRLPRRCCDGDELHEPGRLSLPRTGRIPYGGTVTEMVWIDLQKHYVMDMGATDDGGFDGAPTRDVHHNRFAEFARLGDQQSVVTDDCAKCSRSAI
jgi:hypothetical protein